MERQQSYLEGNRLAVGARDALPRRAGSTWSSTRVSRRGARRRSRRVVSASEAAAWLSKNDYNDAEGAGPEVKEAYAALELA